MIVRESSFYNYWRAIGSVDVGGVPIGNDQYSPVVRCGRDDGAQLSVYQY